MSDNQSFSYGEAPAPLTRPHAPSAVSPQPDVAQAYGMPNHLRPQVSSPAYPAHLQGTCPVSVGKRVAARLLDAVFMSIVAAIFAAIGIALFPNLIELDQEGVAEIIAFVATLPFFILYLTTGWWPCARLLGVRTVQYDQPAVPGGRGLVKHILNSLSLVFAGIPRLIIAFATRDEIERHVVDRVAGVIVLDVRKGR